LLREVDYLGEGRSDEAVARTLIAETGCAPGRSYRRPIRGTGKSNVDARLAGLNAGARYGRPVLILRDLDRDGPCPSALVARLVPGRNTNLLLRIPVCAVESWLLADRAAYALFSGVPEAFLPRDPEALADPKEAVLKLSNRRPRSELALHLADCRIRKLADWQALGWWHARFAEECSSPERTIRTGLAPSLARAFERLVQLA
jgi:hypothetical protein